MKDDLVVKCPAEERVRVTNERGVRRARRSGIEQSFEATGRSFKKKRSNGT